MKIYVVVGEISGYEDCQYWVAGAFASAEQAELRKTALESDAAKLEALGEARVEQGLDYDTNDAIQSLMKAGEIQPLDLKLIKAWECASSSADISYDIEEVELR